MKRRTKVYSTNLIIRFLAFIGFNIFFWIYNIRKNMPPEVKKLKSPYLVLGNHVGFFDPFIVGTFLPKFTHFVASDAVFRSPFFRYILTRVGTIPKKKNIRDTKVIRDIISVIQQGENVGIFPEAVRTWAGTSAPLDPSIIKLIRLLKVPVVVPVLKGMNLFNPRWSVKVRHTRVLVDYTLLFTSGEVGLLSDEVLLDRLSKALKYDEVDYQRKLMNPIRSKIKAEHISHTLYICPECKSIDSFRCSGNDFYCIECNYDIHIDEFGFFTRLTEGVLYFDNIRDWFYWEEGFLTDYVQDKVDKKSNDIIFQDNNSEIYHSKSDVDLYFKGRADVSLYIDRILINYHDLTSEVLNFDDLQTINPQVKERLEIFYNNQAYRIVGGRPGVSALKWEVAVNNIWKNLGHKMKLSPYINFKNRNNAI